MLRYKTVLIWLVLVELIWAVIFTVSLFYEFEVFWKHRFVIAIIFNVLTALPLFGIIKNLRQNPEEGLDIWNRVTFGFFIVANFVCINGFLLFRPLIDWFSL